MVATSITTAGPLIHGAAAVGAAAAGAYGYYGGYNRGCYTDSFGYTICPQQYPY